jgi:hypothetical protein
VDAAVVDLKLLDKSGLGAITEKCRKLVEAVRVARSQSAAKVSCAARRRWA